MIAAIYARKSTEQNGVSDDQKSVARQVEHARAFAESKGWHVAEELIFVDDGISGAEFSNRPGFVRLMNALKPRSPFHALVMSEESRLGREQIETSYSLKQLVSAGVEVWFYMDGGRQRTLDSPTDRIMSALTGFADELEREKARQRTKDALVRKARAGHVAGGDCFGYVNAEVSGPDGQRSHVERRVSDAEATVVRRIFALCAEGYGVARIAKMLNDEQAPRPKPKGRPAAWAPSTVRAILFRDSYRGQLVWNKSAKRDGWGQAKRRQRPASEWVTVARPELRVVTDAEWDAAHARLSTTRATYLRTTNGQVWGRPVTGVASRYLLVGMARCAVCGHGMEVRSRSHGSQRAYYYGCSSFYRRGASICPNRIEVPMLAADGAVLDALLTEVLSPERLSEVVRRALVLARAERAATPDERANVERQLADCQQALQRLTSAVAAGGDVPALVSAIKAADGQRKALESRLQALASPVVALDEVLERRLHKAAGDWRAVLGRQPQLARQIIAKLVAGKITLGPDGDGFRLQATGTVEKLLQAVIPPTGFEPVSPP